MMMTTCSPGSLCSVAEMLRAPECVVSRSRTEPRKLRMGTKVVHNICTSRSSHVWRCTSCSNFEDIDLHSRGGGNHQVAESRDSSGTTVNRRFFCMVPVFATALHEYPASASVLLAQTAPYSNMLLRSLGIGDPDIYYPAFFEGTWNCYSTLIQVTTPQGEDKADRRSVEFSRKQLGYAVPYQVRFTPFEGRVICDRLFTTTSLVEATVGKNVIEEGQWSPQQPNRLVLLLKGGTKVENLVTKRSAEYFQVDQFDTSEFSKQVFDNSAIKDGPPTVKASLNLTRYHWDTAAPVVTKMEAIQKVSIFAVPMEGMEMFNTTTPVTVYKYRIEFERI
ncbi:hypothetical protein MPTK1_6g09330 [Marchantia polymorpha subsp. ruderalis]|uniref:DUF6816 domain-containing protein n=2 Tax=Marchantia polymorpha TaxID=3197 RepID=A0AAF6BQ71_MARPO|nr:hypothetical protein MARPO_0152s0023 [Marchantia polymorpha]BBN14155.1 hypothetical protein Mp_6g09330 [Marchantia polymorpha subsp. ruderalis]|eukprot:PTQ28909.1 hypothetical protein MARPO_0152s0023 [Marchantia polymorpha]